MNMPAEPSPVERPPTTASTDISVAEVMPQATMAHPAAGHETSDVHVTAIFKALGVLAVVTAVCMFGLTRLTAMYERSAKRADPPVSPMAESQTPPLPRLQAQPRDELAKYQAAEQARLDGYRWVDREKKTVEIPIERAMQLLAERGIPAPAGPVGTANPQPTPPAVKETPK